MRIRLTTLATSAPCGCSPRLRQPALPCRLALLVQASNTLRAVPDNAQRIATSDLNVRSATVLRTGREQGNLPVVAGAGHRPRAIGQVRVAENRGTPMDLAVPTDAVIISNSLDRGQSTRVPLRCWRAACRPELRCPPLRVSPRA